MFNRLVQALGAGLVLLGAFALNGCGGVVDPSSNQVTRFSNTLDPGFFQIHDLRVSRRGEYEIRLMELSPESTATVRIDWGPLVNGQCGTVYDSTIAAFVGFPALGGIVTPGTYCVTVADNGSLTQSNTYTVQVSHP
jgi:hypothetical protein